MVAWSEYKQIAQDRGSLALELFVAISTPVKSPQELKAALPEHLAYQSELEQSGALVFAGPLSDLTGEQMEGAGMVVYRAESLAAARTLAEADPIHTTGAREFTLRRWLVNEGSLTLDIKLSAQRVSGSNSSTEHCGHQWTSQDVGQESSAFHHRMVRASRWQSGESCSALCRKRARAAVI